MNICNVKATNSVAEAFLFLLLKNHVKWANLILKNRAKSRNRKDDSD